MKKKFALIILLLLSVGTNMYLIKVNNTYDNYIDNKLNMCTYNLCEDTIILETIVTDILDNEKVSKEDFNSIKKHSEDFVYWFNLFEELINIGNNNYNSIDASNLIETCILLETKKINFCENNFYYLSEDDKIVFKKSKELLIKANSLIYKQFEFYSDIKINKIYDEIDNYYSYHFIYDSNYKENEIRWIDFRKECVLKFE